MTFVEALERLCRTPGIRSNPG